MKRKKKNIFAVKPMPRTRRENTNSQLVKRGLGIIAGVAILGAAAKALK